MLRQYFCNSLKVLNRKEKEFVVPDSCGYPAKVAMAPFIYGFQLGFTQARQ
jgi:hypothetical protein